MNDLSLQTKAAFERIQHSLKYDYDDPLDEIIYNLETLLVRARQIKNEINTNRSGDFQ